MKKRPMFIDIEASGWLDDGGYAIEIAWSDESGVIHSYLINPEPLYKISNGFRYWSDESESVHNISREMLFHSLKC